MNSRSLRDTLKLGRNKASSESNKVMKYKKPLNFNENFNYRSGRFNWHLVLNGFFL